MLHKSNLLKHRRAVENIAVKASISKAKISNGHLSLLLRLRMRITLFKTNNKRLQNIRNWRIRATLFKILYRTVEIALNFLIRVKILWTIQEKFRNKKKSRPCIKHWLSMDVRECMLNRYQIKRSEVLLCLGSKDYRPSNRIQLQSLRLHSLLKKKF